MMSYDSFVSEWQGKQVTKYGAQIGDQLVAFWYNIYMKTLTIISKTHGTVEVLVDDDDYEKIQKLGGKWGVSKKRGKLYAQKHINRKVVELHRWIMGQPKSLYVDHISRDTLDNRKSNLRICSNAANLRNGRVRPQNKTGVTGVYRRKDRPNWYAAIRVNYEKVSLGSFKTFEQAVEARQKANERYWSV